MGSANPGGAEAAKSQPAVGGGAAATMDASKLKGGPLEGETSYHACSEGDIQDTKGPAAWDDFRGRGLGSRAASLRARPAVVEEPGELLQMVVDLKIVL